ncbi:MAG: hypothetical protein KAJ95_05120, partial [Gammaproteobacteria bacterium]|nr:hypothetical protein [Gammaproteobacteria bacterium]
MKNKKRNETESIETGRRKLLTILGKGGAVLGAACALPETWVKPLITSTVLPAHAQTSTIVMNYTFESCSFDFNGMTQNSTGPVTDIIVMAGMMAMEPFSVD